MFTATSALAMLSSTCSRKRSLLAQLLVEARVLDHRRDRQRDRFEQRRRRRRASGGARRRRAMPITPEHRHQLAAQAVPLALLAVDRPGLGRRPGGGAQRRGVAEDAARAAQLVGLGDRQHGVAALERHARQRAEPVERRPAADGRPAALRRPVAARRVVHHGAVEPQRARSARRRRPSSGSSIAMAVLAARPRRASRCRAAGLLAVDAAAGSRRRSRTRGTGSA